MKDWQLTAITGVDGGRGGAVEGDVVINGETALSCIMSLIRKFYALIRKFYRVVLIVDLTNVAVFFALKNLHSALSCVCVCLCFRLSSFVQTHRGRR